MASYYGTRTKLDDDAVKLTIELVSKSLPKTFIAKKLRVSRDTLYLWIEKGNKDINDGVDTIYSEFMHAYGEAEADAVTYHLDEIKSNKKTWTGNAWTLERCWPAEFAANSYELDNIKNEILQLAHDVKNLSNPLRGINNEKKADEIKTEEGCVT